MAKPLPVSCGGSQADRERCEVRCLAPRSASTLTGGTPLLGRKTARERLASFLVALPRPAGLERVAGA